METLIDAATVARMLGIKKGTLYALCRRGELPYVRLTRSEKRPLLRFHQKDIERLVRHRTVAISKESDG